MRWCGTRCRISSSECKEKEGFGWDFRFIKTVCCRFGVEERDGVFPFFIDEQFKLAIAFTQNGFKFAVNGRGFGSTFGYRSNVQVGRLNGLKITSSKGMHMEVTGVDHMHTGDPECTDFEAYSHPELNVLNVAEKVD